MPNGAPHPAHQSSRMFNENMRRRATPALVRGRKMAADVAGSNRAQQRVGERVQPRICVGMPFEAKFMRNANAAQPHVIAFREAMHVISRSAAHISQRL